MDKHHLIPKQQKGKTKANNLVILKREKHVAFHRAFRNRTIGDMLQYFSLLSGYVARKDWEIIFGNKTERQAYLLLDRLWSIKKQIKC
jgi:hypothetical protein